jgi:hypothetical protein
LTTFFTPTPMQIVLDVAGPTVFAGLILLNLAVAMVAVATVYGLEELYNWLNRNRRQ